MPQQPILGNVLCMYFGVQAEVISTVFQYSNVFECILVLDCDVLEFIIVFQRISIWFVHIQLSIDNRHFPITRNPCPQKAPKPYVPLIYCSMFCHMSSCLYNSVGTLVDIGTLVNINEHQTHQNILILLVLTHQKFQCYLCKINICGKKC